MIHHAIIKYIKSLWAGRGRFLLLLLFALPVRAQMIAVNMDAAMLALMAPNIGAELTVGERATLGLNFLTSQRSWGIKVEAYALQPEFRYYFSSRPMNRFFIGAGGIAATYNLDFKGCHYNGYALGAGLTFGYALPLSQRWNIDFHAGYAPIYYRHKQDDEDKSGCFFLPTRIGISVAYIIR